MAAVKPLPILMNAEHLEVHATILRLELAIRAGARDLKLEMDCKALWEQLQTLSIDLSPLGGYVETFRNLPVSVPCLG